MANKNIVAKNSIVQIVNNIPVIDSRELARQLDNKHKNTFELINKHIEILRQWDTPPFQTEVHTVAREKFYLLNENQALFVTTLSKNTEAVVQ